MLFGSAPQVLLAISTLFLTQCAPANTAEQNSDANVRVSIKLMTSLPIIWGEGSSMEEILSGKTKAAPIYKHWQDEYDIEAVDSLEGLAGGTTDVVMLVQPRAMAPADLADLDDWIRKGGNALILTDPELIWPSQLPLGDPQRPLSSGLLSPLLKHWGLELVSRDNATTLVEIDVGNNKITTMGTGSFEKLDLKNSEDTNCEFSQENFIALCQIERGHVILVADADYLHENLWVKESGWPEHGESQAMRFTDALIDDFGNSSKD